MDEYSIKEVELLFNTSIQHGLSHQEAMKRLKSDGYNEIVSVKKKTLLMIFLEQFKDPMVYILLVGAVLSLLLREVIDALIICLVVLLNAGIGAFQLVKSEKALEALQAMMQPTCKVVRDSGVMLIETREVVVGDVIEFEAGDCIPCDIRLVSTTRLMMDESLLSGESHNVSKNEFYRSKEKTA